MEKALFPIAAGISEMRAVLRIISNRANAISLSGLASETGMGIDLLFPLLDACSMLGMCTIRNGVVRASAKGRKLALDNEPGLFAARLLSIEPFRSAHLVLEEYGPMQTQQLGGRLKSAGISFYADRRVNGQLLRMVLLRWGVRCGAFGYDHARDTWRARAPAARRKRHQ